MLETKANVRSKLLTIQQVSAMTNITPRQLRYWERYGIIKPKMVIKGQRRDRRYSLRDVAVLRKALQLRKKRISIKKLSKIIKNPALHFDAKAMHIEQKFFKERPQLIKEALNLLKSTLTTQADAIDKKDNKTVEENNMYIKIVSKVEQIDNILSELI